MQLLSTLLLALSAAVFARMAWMLRGLSPSIVRLQLTFTPGAFGRVLGAWTHEQRERFRKHFALDYAFIVLYAAAGVAGGHTAWLALPAAAAADVAENLLHQHFLRRGQAAVPAWAYALAGCAAALKWVAFGASVLLAALAFLGR